MDIPNFEAFLKQKYQVNALRSCLGGIVESTLASGPLPKDCNTMIMIPSRSTEPAEMAFNTIGEYVAENDGNTGLFFLVNGVPSGRFHNSPALTGIYQGIEEYGRNIPIYCSYVEKDKTRGNIGNIRLDLATVSMQLAQNQDVDLDQAVLVTNDVDVKSVPRGYIQSINRVFKRNPKTKAMSGPCLLPIDTLAGNRILRLYEGFLNHMSGVTFFRNNHVTLYGGNTAIRAKDYIRIGGHESSQRGENASLNRKLKESDPNSVVYNPGMGIVTDPRRQLLSMNLDIPIVRSHLTFGTDEDLAIKYKKKITPFREPVEWVDRLSRELSEFYFVKARITNSVPILQENMLKALSLTGVQGAFEGDQFEIVNKELLEKTVDKFEV